MTNPASSRSSSGYAARTVEDLPTLWDGFAKLVGSGLDITGFGVNIMDLPADYATTAHDEAETGQQELYVALRGAGAVVIDGVAQPLDGTTSSPSTPARAGALVRAGRPARALHRRRARRRLPPPGLERQARHCAGSRGGRRTPGPAAGHRRRTGRTRQARRRAHSAGEYRPPSRTARASAGRGDTPAVAARDAGSNGGETAGR